MTWHLFIVWHICDLLTILFRGGDNCIKVLGPDLFYGKACPGIKITSAYEITLLKTLRNVSQKIKEYNERMKQFVVKLHNVITCHMTTFGI